MSRDLPVKDTLFLKMVYDGRGTFNQNALCSLIARRPKQEDSLEDMAESLKILCNESSEENKAQLKISVDQFRFAMQN